MGSPGRASPSPRTAPASAPSGPGSSRCLRAAPLKPCASAHVLCVSLSGASCTQPAWRASQTGADFFLASAATSTAAPADACFFSLAAIDGFVDEDEGVAGVGVAGGRPLSYDVLFRSRRCGKGADPLDAEKAMSYRLVVGDKK